MRKHQCIFVAIVVIIILYVFAWGNEREDVLYEENRNEIIAVSEKNCAEDIKKDGDYRMDDSLKQYKYYASGLVLKKYPYSKELNSGDLIMLERSKLVDTKTDTILVVDYENEVVTDISHEAEYEVERHGIYAVYIVVSDENGQENPMNVTDKVTISAMYPENMEYGDQNRNSFGFIPLKDVK